LKSGVKVIKRFETFEVFRANFTKEPASILN
jgi:hypothetical protein